MQIKAADDRRPDIDALLALLQRPDVSGVTRSRIEQEVRAQRAAVKGERDAAHAIEHRCGPKRSRATLHGLRFEHGGHVAEIGHVIVTRSLAVFACDSRHFGSEVTVTPRGEWSAFREGRLDPILSPIEENRRGCLLLEELFESGALPLPRRLGVTVRPTVRGLVFISNGAHLAHPGTRVNGLDSIVSAETLSAGIECETDGGSPLGRARSLGDDAVESFARSLAALHRPVSIDWPAAFGLPAVAALPPRLMGRIGVPAPTGPTCASCSGPITQAEIRACSQHPDRFGGRDYCSACQSKVSPARRFGTAAGRWSGRPVAPGSSRDLSDW